MGRYVIEDKKSTVFYGRQSFVANFHDVVLVKSLAKGFRKEDMARQYIERLLKKNTFTNAEDFDIIYVENK